jgi:AraC-like DNA-binding protein
MAIKFEERGLSSDWPGKVFCKQEASGETVRLHYHSSLEINILHDLRGTVNLGEYSFNLSGKQSIIIPPGEIHSYAIEPSPGGYVFVCQLSAPLLAPLVREDTLPDLYPPSSCSSKPLPEIQELIMEKQRFLTPVETARLLFTLLDTVSPQSSRRVLPPSSGGQLVGLKRVIDFVEWHYGERITLSQAAEIAGRSRSAFAEQFTLLTGTTFHRFLLQVRLEYSCIHLSRGQTVTEVAHSCGFTDASHFIKCFKACYRQTPLAFQKSIS